MGLSWTTTAHGQSSLRKAIEGGEFEKVEEILKNTDDLERKLERSINGLSALNYATSLAADSNRTSKRKIVEALLEAGADVNTVSSSQQTPLHFAVEGSGAKLVELLLKYSPDVNIKNGAGETALHLAIRSNTKIGEFHFLVEVIKTLFKQSDLSVVDSQFNMDYLDFAIWHSNWTAVDAIVDVIAEEKLTLSGNPMLVASGKNDVEAVQAVIKMINLGFEIPKTENWRPQKIGEWALDTGNVELIKALLEHGDDFENYVRGNPLLYAVRTADECFEPIFNYYRQRMTDEQFVEITNGYDDKDLLASAINYKAGPETLKRLVSIWKNFDLDKPGKYQTYLADAAWYGQLSTIELLLDAGADIEAIGGGNQNSPLMAAAMMNQVEAFDLLIQKGARRDAKNKQGHTVFHSVCSSGNFDFIKRELEFVADINVKSQNGDTPVYFALYGEDAAEILKLLLDRGATMDFARIVDEGTAYPHPLHFHTTMENADMVEQLLVAGADPNCRQASTGNTVLHFLVNSGVSPDESDRKATRLSICRSLLNHGADPTLENANNQTPLKLAIERGRSFLVPQLWKGFAFNETKLDDDRGQFLIHWACRLGDEDLVDSLIDEKANLDLLDKNQNTPLHVAVVNGQKEIARKLARRNPRALKAANGDGETAVQIAAWKGFTEVLKVLLENGGNAEAVDSSGETLLHYAAWKGHHDILLLLIEKKVNVNASTLTGRTPLHSAAWQGDNQLCQILLQFGADVNAVDEENETALYKAAMRGQHGVIQILIAHDANKTIKSTAGFTAAEIAKSQGYEFEELED